LIARKNLIFSALLPIAPTGKHREIGLKPFGLGYRTEFDQILTDLLFYTIELKHTIECPARIEALLSRQISVPILVIVQFLGSSFRHLELAMADCQQILDKFTKSNPAILPESMIPFVIHVLAIGTNLEEDPPDLPTFGIYFKVFSEPAGMSAGRLALLDRNLNFISRFSIYIS
jgi:hypothetical protein